MNDLDKLFFNAIEENDFNEAKDLLLKGANVNVIADDSFCDFIFEGETPLIVAARSQNSDALIFLLDNGADINYQNIRNGDTALMNASLYGEIVISGTLNSIALLLERGADINAVNYNKRTALASAIHHYISQDNLQLNDCFFSAIQFLVNQGTDINIQDYRGMTPLMMAFLDQNYDEIRLLELLIKRDNNLLLRDRKGRTALDFKEDANELFKSYFELASERKQLMASIDHLHEASESIFNL